MDAAPRGKEGLWLHAKEGGVCVDCTSSPEPDSARASAAFASSSMHAWPIMIWGGTVHTCELWVCTLRAEARAYLHQAAQPQVCLVHGHRRWRRPPPRGHTGVLVILLLVVVVVQAPPRGARRRRDRRGGPRRPPLRLLHRDGTKEGSDATGVRNEATQPAIR